MMLSVVIVNYKTPDLVARCIRSLADTIKTTPYEIIVVDSQSDGSTPRLLAEQFPNASCLPFSENTGYGRGVNAGLNKARGELVLILNPDITALPHAIDELVSFMEHEGKRRRIGMAGPKLVWPDGTFQPSAFRFYTPLTVVLRRTPLGKLPFFGRHLDRFFLKEKQLAAAQTPQDVEWLRGGALLVSREALQDVGPMDERFFMYFEDVDWARRFWENGWRVAYVPSGTMVHQYQRSSHRFGLLDAAFNKLTRAHIASALKYFMKYRFKTVRYV